MQTKKILPVIAAASGAVAQTAVLLPSGGPPPAGPGPEVPASPLTITTVLDSFVTYCPEPTVFTYNDECYTAMTPGELTITNCPCTVESVRIMASETPLPP